MQNVKIVLFAAAIALAGPAAALAGEFASENLNAPLSQALSSRMTFSRWRIPQERLDEISRQLKPGGWAVDTCDLGDWTIYMLKHLDGTIWQTHFANTFFREVYWLQHPEWIPIENSETGALLLEKRPSLEAAGWHAAYVLKTGSTGYPDLSYQLISAGGKVRSTEYESEFRHWLNNGPESCWYPDRPFPNCEMK